MVGSAPSIVGGQLGRYELHGAIARGGMATVHIGRMSGAAGFARTVAIKRLHPHLAADQVFASMFVDEARLAARIQHPNVVDTLDVVNDGAELLIVMEFVHGETLAKLVRAAGSRSLCLPAPVVATIVIGALEGLHAAHEATNERGEALGIVHRDISPQNILVATDGVPRVLDFGVAKAAGRIQETEGGELKGKLAYMSPEQLTRKTVDRRSDVFAMGIVLWEALTTTRLFGGEDAASTLFAILNAPIRPPSALVPGLSAALDEVVLKALERDPDRRYATAEEMAVALESACPPAPVRQVAKWVNDLAAEQIRIRADLVRAVEGAGPASVMATVGQDVPSQTGSGSQRIVSSISTVSSVGASHVSSLSSVSSVGASHVSSLSSVSNLTGMSAVAPSPSSAPFPPPAPGGTASTSGLVGAFIATSAVLLLVGIGFGFHALTHGKPPPVPAASAAFPADPAPPPALPAVEGAPSPAVTLPVPPPLPEEPAASASSSASARPGASSAQGQNAPAPRVVVTPPKPKPSAANDCENPFIIEPNGIKRVKAHCFNR